jgi:hypothetical protein
LVYEELHLGEGKADDYQEDWNQNFDNETLSVSSVDVEALKEQR